MSLIQWIGGPGCTAGMTNAPHTKIVWNYSPMTFPYCTCFPCFCQDGIRENLAQIFAYYAVFSTVMPVTATGVSSSVCTAVRQ